ncbi:MAG: T9SS type A sorting domain-containing protein [Bacteroidetes bacterium]|nr:T9SS type A sorting domain-containing protein [Bacteroidota bacterium]
MKKIILTLFSAAALYTGGLAQTTVTITATGASGSYNTGSVNSAGTKNDGDMTTLNSSSNVGWAFFDLSSLPTGIVVSSASCTATTFSSTSSSATNSLTVFSGTPSSMAGTALYSAINGGATALAAPWTANATITGPLNAAGCTFIQNRAGADMCVGFVRGSTNTYNIRGYGAVAGQQPQLVITYSVLPACSGAPTAGTTTASSTSICTPQNIALGLSGVSAATGLSYQWESSPDGITWTAIPTATTVTTSQLVNATMQYHCIVSCGASSATSTPVTVTLLGTNYAAVPFLETFDNTWQNRCNTRDVPVALTWVNTPNTGNNSWRRQDDGASAGWSGATGGIVTPIGTGSADFHSYFASSGSKGNLDLYVNMGTLQNYQMSFYHINQTGTDSLFVLLSTDNGATFTQQGSYASGDFTGSTSWKKYTLTLGSVNSASCVVRFTGKSDYGNDDIGLDSLNIIALSSCSGMPTAGTAISTNTLLCSPANVTLSLSGSTLATGLTYQWESSPDGITWTAIPTATLATTTQSVSAATQFHCIVSCGTNSATSTPVTVSMLSPSMTYVTIPYLETFDNTWENRCDNHNVPVAVSWQDNPTTGNNSWRRQDDGASAGWTSATNGVVTPIGTGSADFHSYYAPSGATGTLDLYANMGTTQNYVMSFYHINKTGNDSLFVFLSTDNGVTFTQKGSYASGDFTGSTSWKKYNMTLGSVNSASCVVRFTGKSDYGMDDIGLDSLAIFTATCTVPPVAGTISGLSTLNIHQSTNYTVSPGTGDLQWYVSTSPSGPWSAIPNATVTTQPLTASQAGTFYLSVIASSIACPNDTTHTPFMIHVDFPGDSVCGALPLPVLTGTASSSVYYDLGGATVQSGEVAPPGGGCAGPMSWCNNTLNNTMWFTFTAPASGHVSIQSPDFDTRLALWQANTCNGLLSAATATLMGANDDDANYTAHGGVQFSSYVERGCLTPGALYYVQLDSYSTATVGDSTRVLVKDMGALDLSFSGLQAGYCLPTTVIGTITPVTGGGVFSVNSSTVAVGTFTFNPNSSPAGTYTVSYNVMGCTSYSTTTITNNTVVVTAAATSSAVCVGQSDSLMANGASTYTWSTSQTTAHVAVTPTANTSYTVTGADLSGCTNTATISVSVVALPTVSLTASQASVCVNGTPIILTGNPAGGAYSGTSVSGSTFTPSATAGTYTPVYSYTNSTTGCANTASVSITVDACTGIARYASDASSLSVYPNPTAHYITVQGTAELGTVTIYNAIGQVVEVVTIKDTAIQINVSAYPAGIYTVLVQGVYSKFVKE